MPDNFPKAIKVLLGHEGGKLVPDDNGRGPSKWGVTFETAKDEGYTVDPQVIIDLTELQAEGYYRMYWWNPNRLYRIDDLDLATKVFDLCVNTGAHTTIKMLQRAAGVPDNQQDGILGPITAAHVNALDPVQTLAALRTLAEQHYRNLAASNPIYAKNLDGWLSRLAT